MRAVFLYVIGPIPRTFACSPKVGVASGILPSHLEIEEIIMIT
jgi:hypothetical protein